MQGAVGLTEQQKEAVLAARHDLLSRMTSVLEERQSLVNSLQVTHIFTPASCKGPEHHASLTLFIGEHENTITQLL